MKTYARSVMLGSVLLYFVLFCSVRFGLVQFCRESRRESVCVCLLCIIISVFNQFAPKDMNMVSQKCRQYSLVWLPSLSTPHRIQEI